MTLAIMHSTSKNISYLQGVMSIPKVPVYTSYFLKYLCKDTSMCMEPLVEIQETRSKKPASTETYVNDFEISGNATTP